MQPVLWMVLGVPAGFLARFLLGCDTAKWYWNLLCGVLGAALAAQAARCCGWPGVYRADLYGLTLSVVGACLLQGTALPTAKKLK